MRLILLFDLPVNTKSERTIYARFRKHLISKGYLMLQYSVYVKMFPNRDSAINHINAIKRETPKKGNIRLLLLTEKQYAKMTVIVGGKSFQENIITKESLLIL